MTPDQKIQPDGTLKPSRRRTLGWLAAIGLSGAAIGRLWPGNTNRYYSGPVSDHFDGVRFFNPSGTKPKGISELLKWQFASPSEKWPDAFPSPFVDRPPPTIDGLGVRISFIGHASFLIQGAGHAILIDPVYGQRASPVSFAGPRRANAPGVPFDALPKIDTVIVTHNHYDHMDMDTLARLHARDQPHFVTPPGNDTILRAGIGGINVSPLDWHQSLLPVGGLIVEAVPTQHWSARGLNDRLHALWASFVIKIAGRTIYAVGDSGFGDGATFRAIAARYPGIDVALLPIGAYEPRWFMRDQHMNPDDAVQALKLCGAKAALGHHWGTFKLTNEGIEQPREALSAALAAQRLPNDRFLALRPGEVHVI